MFFSFKGMSIDQREVVQCRMCDCLGCWFTTDCNSEDSKLIAVCHGDRSKSTHIAVLCFYLRKYIFWLIKSNIPINF